MRFPPLTFAAAYEKAGRHAPGFDTLRVLAASAVVLHHSQSLDFSIPEDPLFELSHGYTTIGFIAVCLFFCVSGFLVAPGLLKSGNVLSYFSRRIMRIMPLLTVVVVATVFLFGPVVTSLPLPDYFGSPQTWLYLKNITTSLSVELPGVAGHGGGRSVNGALWTLRYEWLCYIMLALLLIVGILRKRLATLAIWLACVLVSALTFRDQTDMPGQALMFTHMFAYFGAGTLIYLYRDAIPVSPLLAVGALILLAVALSVGAGAYLGPPLTAYLVAALGLVRWPWSGFLAKADISNGVYLMHGPVMILIVHFWHPQQGMELFAATMALVIPLALCSWFFIEKPALQLKNMPAELLRRLMPGKRQGRVA